MPLQSAFSLVSIRTPIARLCVHKRARVRLDLHVLCFDVCIQRLLFPERLAAWRKLGAVVLGVVYVLVPLQSSVRREALPAARPVTSEGSRNGRVAMGVLDVALQMVFAGKRLVAVRLRAGKGTLLVVASHVCLETAWAVEALVAALESADVVPLAACLAVCSHAAIARVVDDVILVVF